ncbi:HNH endonuclease [Reichenbachiella carrageenanivorans]|uniref:HNH endonuclease n=1 Tax=Reichenbachiella carrageenanivorans TaxID=2979869 RepID=A0ABY6D0U7_9BACT|nr:HNH endonuclease signature motif containing protein [Reichenbachiella carrageenanivorans]UXX79795.1 HNH endonuclease [Reichenbachiella carrageenanivorans]
MSYRVRSTSRGGANFDAATVQAVWEKGRVVTGYDPSYVRKDTCGALMQRSEYGNTNSKFGWEIDHVVPVSKGGSDALSNLQPLQWENNRHKSDDYPGWSCKVKAA